MTLVELSIVIVVLLAFISMLFIGARAWKRGADRAQCIVNIRQVQMSVRGFANSNGIEAGEYFTPDGAGGVPGDAIFGPDNYLDGLPTCPGTGMYTIHGNLIPDVGMLYMTCSLEASAGHVQDTFGTW